MDYKLKNRDGVETTYAKDKIKIPAATGDNMVVFTQGEVQDSKSVTITENGTTEVTPDAGYGSVKNVGVTVNVPTPKPALQEKAVNITSNGQTSVTPDAGKDGLSKVDITVAVPTPAPTLQKKSISITANGTGSVLPDAGKDGLSEVDYTVNVPASTPVLQEKTVTITANSTTEVTPDSGQDGLSKVTVDVDVPSAVYNPEGINFIDTDGTIAESWTLSQLQKADALPAVPSRSYGAKSVPVISHGDYQIPADDANIALALAWNSTLAELKEANEPANVGLCYNCNYEENTFDYGFKTYNIALAPHIVVLELPQAMNFTIRGDFRFWDNGLGQRVTTPTNQLSFPAAGKYCVQYWIRTEVEAKQEMISEEMRPYVKAIIFPMADKDKMSIGGTSYYFKTDFRLMANPYYKCPNIKTVAFSPRCGGAGIYEGPAEWDANGFFLGCYSLETVSIPVAPSGYGGNGFSLETTFRRVPSNENPYGALSYNLKNIIVPKAASSRMDLTNCIGGIEAIVFNGVRQALRPEGIMPQSWIESNQNTVVPWPNLKLIDLSRAAGDVSDFHLLFGRADSQYMKLKLPAGKSITIKVPASQLDAYKTADGWKDFADYIVGV